MNAENYKTKIEQIKQDLWQPNMVDEIFGSGTYRHMKNNSTFSSDAKKMNVNFFVDEKLDRIWFECFLAKRSLMTKRWAALYLGITVNSFDNIRQNDKLAENFDVGEKTFSDPDTILFDSHTIRKFEQTFLGSKLNVYSNRNERLKNLHYRLYDLFGEIEVCMCSTSKKLGENPIKIAKNIDILSGEPVSNDYEILLNLDKPPSLKLDCVSLQTYILHRELLEQYAMITTWDLYEIRLFTKLRKLIT